MSPKTRLRKPPKHPDYKGGHGRKHRSRFRGNQFTKSRDGTTETSEDTAGPSSAKAYKLADAESRLNLSSTEDVEFEIMDFKSVSAGLTKVLACKTCGGNVDITTNGRRALGFKISVKCLGKCDKEVKKMDSCEQIGAKKNSLA